MGRAVFGDIVTIPPLLLLFLCAAVKPELDIGRTEMQLNKSKKIHATHKKMHQPK